MELVFCAFPPARGIRDITLSWKVVLGRIKRTGFFRHLEMQGIMERRACIAPMFLYTFNLRAIVRSRIAFIKRARWLNRDTVAKTDRVVPS